MDMGQRSRTTEPGSSLGRTEAVRALTRPGGRGAVGDYCERMELTDALGAARATHQSILVTTKSDGRPHLTNVLHHLDDDGVARISTTATRAKAHNIERDPWAALHVNGDTFFSYAVLEGEAELSEPAAATDDAVVDELVALYRAISGEHDDWDAYRRAMVDEQRLVVRFRPERAYGSGELPKPSEPSSRQIADDALEGEWPGDRD